MQARTVNHVLALAATLLSASSGLAADFKKWDPPPGVNVSFPFPMANNDGTLTPYVANVPLAPPAGLLVLRMEGPVEEGDADRLRAAAGKTDPWGNVVLWMNSDGGNFEAGIALGDAIADLHILTFVGPGDRCLSACAFAFLGGQAQVSEDGTTVPTRQLHTDGRLGFHAPSLPGSVPAEVLAVPGASEALAEDFARPTLDNIAELQVRAAPWLLSSDMLAKILRHVGQDEFITIDRAYEAMQNEILIVGPPNTAVTSWGAVEAMQACSLILGNALWQQRLDLPIPAFGGGFEGWLPGAAFFRNVLSDTELSVKETSKGPVVVWKVDAPRVGGVTCTVKQGAQGPVVQLAGKGLPEWTTVAQTMKRKGGIPVSRLGLLGYGVPWTAIGADDLYIEDRDALWKDVPPDVLAAADAIKPCASGTDAWPVMCRFPTLGQSVAVLEALGDKLEARQHYLDAWRHDVKATCRSDKVDVDDAEAEMFAGYCGLMIAQDLARQALGQLAQ